MLYFEPYTSGSPALVSRLRGCEWSWGTGELFMGFAGPSLGLSIHSSTPRKGYEPFRALAYGILQLIPVGASKTPPKPRVGPIPTE